MCVCLSLCVCSHIHTDTHTHTHTHTHTNTQVYQGTPVSMGRPPKPNQTLLISSPFSPFFLFPCRVPPIPCMQSLPPYLRPWCDLTTKIIILRSLSARGRGPGPRARAFPTTSPPILCLFRSKHRGQVRFTWRWTRRSPHPPCRIRPSGTWEGTGT